MAKFSGEVPQEILQGIEQMNADADRMLEEMVGAGAKVVYRLVQGNMQKSFKSTKSLEKGLRMTKVYKTPSDDGINVHVGFYGYNDEGVPIPLIANAREYGTSSGEQKKPFFRKSFNKAQIEQAMLDVQSKYIKDSD